MRRVTGQRLFAGNVNLATCIFAGDATGQEFTSFVASHGSRRAYLEERPRRRA